MTLAAVIFAIVVFSILAILALSALPIGGRKYNFQLNDLSNAKQIYLGLAMYAGDHNGAFPSHKADGFPFANANEAFRLLIPDYIPTELLFHVHDSPWTPARPDDITGNGKTLTAGENHWAYTPNLDRDTTPRMPIIADGFAKGTPGTYDTWTKKHSNIKARLRVVVIRADGLGEIKTVSKDDLRVYGFENGKTIDLFKPAPNWLRPDQMPLNPEG